jgi:hypothetical protein|eukprot:SAG11_NODE_1046_length_6042_cov_12.954400_6_plen_82_part_00
MAEINANLESPFLREDPATTVSYSNPNRPISYHFKGLPTEYKQYILDTQMQQVRDGLWLPTSLSCRYARPPCGISPRYSKP